MGLVGGTRVGILGMLGYWLTSVFDSMLKNGQTVEQASVLNYGLLLSLSGILLVFLLTGGLAVLRHSIIRLLLWLSHTFPGPASQFLNDATARILLLRIGGGYSFIHRLLLDHLADTDAGTTRDVDALSTQPLRAEQQS